MRPILRPSVQKGERRGRGGGIEVFLALPPPSLLAQFGFGRKVTPGRPIAEETLALPIRIRKRTIPSSPPYHVPSHPFASLFNSRYVV